MKHSHAELERAKSALWHLPCPGNREEWWPIVGSALAEGIDEEELMRWCACGDGFKESDVRSTIRSLARRPGTGGGSLFKLARDTGWPDDNSPLPVRLPQERKPLTPAKPPPHDPKTVWDACSSAPTNHPYIERKLGLPEGLRVYSGNLTIAGQSCDGALVLPCFTLDGQLATLQFVPPEGKKVFLPGVSIPEGACLVIGGQIAGKPVYLTEGIGQAWSAHQATGCPAVVCFGWGRVAGVADVLRAEYPSARLVIVPDAGKEQQAEAIARKIKGAFCEMLEGSNSNTDINDLHQSEGLQAVASLLQQAKAPPQRYKVMTPAEIAALPPLCWRVRDVLPADGIAALYGGSGDGKTFLGLDLLGTVAKGGVWFGNRVTPAPVLYIGLEGEAGIAQRLKAHQMRHGALSPGFRFILQPLNIRNPADRAEMVTAANAAGYSDGVLCIDTLNRAAPGADENDSAAMSEIIAAAKSLQTELGGLVLLIHHTGKDASKGPRGHSSLYAALYAAIEVRRDGERREWRIAKAKDGSDGLSHPFRLEAIDLGTDDDGEKITSCCIVPEETSGKMVRRALPPKSGNQRIIWDALGELFRTAGCVAPEGAPKELHVGRPCLRLEDAIVGARTRLVCDSKRQTERTAAAITGLINRGLLECREGWLWCA